MQTNSVIRTLIWHQITPHDYNYFLRKGMPLYPCKLMFHERLENDKE
jgi:hypothetical protein